MSPRFKSKYLAFGGLILVGGLLAAFNNSAAPQKVEPLHIGGIYVRQHATGTYPYTVEKVLAVSRDGIAYIRTYRDSYKEFPKDLDVSILSRALPSPEEVNDSKMLSYDSPVRVSVGCMPIELKSYVAEEKTLIPQISETVTQEELESCSAILPSTGVISPN